ncbi:interleukin-18 receptor 1 [Ailuropoda melanoleuca]|uniref:interleukin-18 receptor 1 n=1 Tax=Ailuropoda melanoleuca TaxID=9646 RepID=UPI001494C422|nr:interleukin-18 receptor 1 [Ailuropoda melanoleuca]
MCISFASSIKKSETAGSRILSMCHTELLLTILVLMFTRTSETCTSRFNITAVRGEPFYLRYCSSGSEHEDETVASRWYKGSGPHGRTELRSSSSPRISLHDYALEFWPVELEDSGSYFFQMGNDTHEWKLNVIGKSKHSCFAEKQLISKTVEVQKSLHINCKHPYYEELAHRISLYKNCEKMENNKNPVLQKNAEFEDQGYYTCVFFIPYNGKLFNVTKTFNVTVVGDRSKIIPVLLGPKVNHVKVELGKDVELNCSALANEKDAVYWNVWEENGKEANVHEDSITRTRYVHVMHYFSRRIQITFCCRLGHFEGRHINMLVEVADTRKSRKSKPYFLDGKTYDAFVSYLKECGPENGEEHTFAVEILPRVLEKHFGYKLCIFERDVVPGGAIVDEIHSLIEKSRRLIIVLSKSYMSNEVRYELESGLHEALVERKIKIILIEFTPVRDFTFFPQSLQLLKSHRVLKWDADKPPSYNSRFWKNLLYLMPAKMVKPCGAESEVLPVLSRS